VSAPGFLNLHPGDPGVRVLLEGVVLADGVLRLATVHGAPEPLTDAQTAALGGPAGIGVGPDGTIYVADPEGDRVLRIPACGGPAEEVGCLRRVLSRPRGLVAGPREALYVSDTGHHRIVVVDLATEQIRTMWGQADRFADPVAGTEPGRLDRPTDLAADTLGRIYVVDHGNRRLQRFEADGALDDGFRAAIAAEATRPTRPEWIATALVEDVERLLVFDRTGPRRSRLLVYGLDGDFHPGITRRLRRLLAGAAPTLFTSAPGALAGDGSRLHVVEQTTGAVLTFDLDGTFLGSSGSGGGSAAGLALDPQGRLLLLPASGVPARLAAGRPAREGAFRLGPFSAPGDPESVWRRLSVAADLPEDAHLRIYTHSAADANAVPPPLGAGTNGAWQAVPPDALDALVPSSASPFLWLGGRLQAGAAAGPSVTGFRLEFGEGWLRHLPAIYSHPEPARFLEPALALLESALADEEALIDDLPRLFDPAAAPAERLAWLAGWVALDQEDSLSEPARRAAIAAAFERHGRRGQAGALRELLRIALGVDAAVTEPARSLWILGDGESRLGARTGLAAAEPDGAVLGRTATLDRSNLLVEEERGAATLGALANRYCVRVFGSDLPSASARAALRRIVAREQPLGTDAHVCIVEPRARVGAQATLGVDAIVARAGTPLRLGREGELGAGAALAPGPHRPLTADGRTRLGRVPAMT
jgi:phage tail-like protein